MTIIPCNGRNQRLGQLFKTPKQNLLYKGRPAIQRTKEYMEHYGEVMVAKFGHATESQVDTIRQALMQAGHVRQFYAVDCDVVPLKLNPPQGTTAYVFRPQFKVNQYSNFSVSEDSIVEECNEKGLQFDYCGAGVYYFRSAVEFMQYSQGRQTCAQVFSALIRDGKIVFADTTSEIFRFGTLHDITGL